MIKEVLLQMGWGNMQASSLVIFFMVMSLVICWAYRPAAKKVYEEMSARPLWDDETSRTKL